MFTHEFTRSGKGSSGLSRRRRWGRKFRIEALEPRAMLSAMSLTDGDVLTVTGTDMADEISAYVKDDLLHVVVNGVTWSFANDSVSHINILGEGGDDVIKLDGTVRQSTSLEGGRGDDTIQGGSGRDRIDGGTGDDTLSGGRGNDYVQGGWGDDHLSGNAGNDHLVGEFGGEVEIVHGQQGCDPPGARDPSDHVEDVELVLQIQVADGLVEKQDPRFLGEGLGHEDHLPLAAAEFVEISASEAFETHLLQDRHRRLEIGFADPQGERMKAAQVTVSKTVRAARASVNSSSRSRVPAIPRATSAAWAAIL